jgi:hypothetical protein
MKNGGQFTYTLTETTTYYFSMERSKRGSCFLFEHLRTSDGLERQLSVHKYNNIANQV